MDRERFLQEVLLPLSRGEEVTFRRFDCGAMALTPPVTVPYAPFQVVEGTYCLHPELAPYYTYSVFLRISPEEQRRQHPVPAVPRRRPSNFFTAGSRWSSFIFSSSARMPVRSYFGGPCMNTLNTKKISLRRLVYPPYAWPCACCCPFSPGRYPRWARP